MAKRTFTRCGLIRKLKGPSAGANVIAASNGSARKFFRLRERLASFPCRITFVRLLFLLRFFLFSFSYICMVSRGQTPIFNLMFDYSGLFVVILIVVVPDNLYNLLWNRHYSGLRKNRFYWFPRKMILLIFLHLQPFNIDINIRYVWLSADYVVLLLVVLEFNQLQKPATYLAFCSRFRSWTDLLRSLISFSSPLKQVGISFISICLVIFLWLLIA